MKKTILFLAAVISILAWSCSKSITGSGDLKQSLNNSQDEINNAMETISNTKGFEILSGNSLSLKSEVTYSDSISLSMISGIYDFQPDPYQYYDFFVPYRLFKKTGESDHLIVNLPEKLVIQPKYLHDMNWADSLLVNNFTIDASDYHFYYSWLNSFDYKLEADFLLDSVDIGTLDVVSSFNGESGRSYSSKYTFTDRYKINVSYQGGDSAVKSFALLKDDDILLKETVVSVSTFEEMHNHHREKLYILTLGNVEIRRGSGIDSIQVYLDGVLQKEAGVKIVDTTASEGSICRHRDILLTFDDGTTTNLSDLIAPAREVLATLVDGLHSMNFARHVVDYIAAGINYHYHHHHHHN